MTGPGQVVHCSFPTLQEVDWEVELAVVIGRKGKYIKVRRKGGATSSGLGKWSAPTCWGTCLVPRLPPLTSSGY